METLRFDGRVAIVTGGARGIGLAHAQLLASRGARVVVNDLGGAMTGGGRDDSLAEAAVASIRGAGGEAEADGSDIATPEGARALVDRAITAYGRVDAVLNNAGIFDMDAFPDVEWDEVARYLTVHVGGSFNVTRAAWPHLIESGAGRVVMTTSTGALGADNMTAYGTAKAGVIGLARALAMAGAPHGIKVNMVSPMAMTRMMRAGMERAGRPAEEDPTRRPELVSPLVGLLAHERCPANGEIFLSGMRRYARLFIAETQGYVHPSRDVSIEDIAEHWDEISDDVEYAITSDTMSWSARNEEAIAAVGLA